jgi:transcription elongation factor GreB
VISRHLDLLEPSLLGFKFFSYAYINNYMSRAFVKENDLEHAGIDIPERPVSAHANYVTPTGLKQLEAEADRLEKERLKLKELQAVEPLTRQKIAMIDRDLRYIGARLSSAIPVEHQPAAKQAAVLFGAKVTVEDEDEKLHTFMIVGEDEADIASNKISYISPIAKALIGRKIGDTVEWHRPIGDTQLTIIAIE